MDSSASSVPALLDVLSTYHRRGWALVALHHIRDDGTCSCGNPRRDPDHDRKQGGKHPLATDWTANGLTAWPDIMAVWEAAPRANVGIVTGRPSGFWVLDYDPDNAGPEAGEIMGRLALDLRPWPTLTHGTGSGGEHYLFLLPDDFEPTNSARGLPTGLDVRGTGGQVVAPPSVSGKGPYAVALDPGGLRPAPGWLLDMIRPSARAEAAPAPITPMATTAHPYALSGVAAELSALAALREGSRNTVGHTIACNLRELLNSGWAGLAPMAGQIRADFVRILTGLGLPEAEAIDLWDTKSVRTVGAKSRPAPPELSQASPERPELDVSNESDAARWLTGAIGTGVLAGVFRRGGELVYTPAIGEYGYRPPASGDDGPVQVQPLDPRALAARVHAHWDTFRKRLATERDQTDEEYVRRSVLFPMEAARTVLAAPDLIPHARPLRGVVHAPMVRADGSVLETPGYDPASRVLFLPEPELYVPPVSAAPSVGEIQRAVGLLRHMLSGFPFVADADLSGYLGLLLTPLLRDLAPAPYKMVVINAHQPGSGKTLLATVARLVHGGVMRSEMPEDDAELRKQITTILSVTTGPIVHIDNVSGRLTSSTLSGLLTSADWDDRRLGSNDLARCVNDRVWTLTGNNVAIGDDLARRTVWVSIDPGMPNPEFRSGFAIPDLPGWVKANRGHILHALLTLVRAWIAAGRPGVATSSDGYGEWGRAVNGILAVAGLPARFDLPIDRPARESVDDQEWAEFLGALELHFGADPFTARQALDLVAGPGEDTMPGGIVAAAKPIPADMLPTDLADKFLRAPHGQGPALLSKSLGRWLGNRQGRWVGDRTVRRVAESASGGRKDGVKWYIERAPNFSG